MSTAVGSGKQPDSFNEENEALYDPYPGFAVDNQRGKVPWPEWSDSELNAEAWDEGKVGKTGTVGPKGAPQLPPAQFDDPDPPELLPELSAHVHTWRRPQLVFPGATLTVFDPSNAEFQMRVNSALSDCTFFRAFADQTTILHYHAIKYGYQVEMETPNFVSNTQGEPWRPWHHVYAMCKAGKGQVHKPVYCPYGKYVVRLFYMGAWRRFVVDDKIPCDSKGNCMLPTTLTPGELWPIVLSKAILKILSLTPADLRLVDFNVLAAFTGWTHASFAAENKTYEQVWRRLSVLVPRYEQKNDEPEKLPSPKMPSSSKKESRMTSKEEKEGRFCFLLANLLGISEEDLTVDCSVAVTLTRDCPLVKAEKRPGTKPWKRIRWTDWAKEKGLWVDEDQLPPYRRLQVITFFPELAEMVAPDPKLEAALYDIPLEDTEEEGEGDKLFEPEQWCDYFKLLRYFTSVSVFFKPSYFTSTFRITCLPQKTVESPPVSKATSKAAPPPPPLNSFLFSTLLKPTFNEPVYLLCEATTGIFLCVSLWVCPQSPKDDFGYLEADQPKILKVGHAGLVVESHDWRLIPEGKILGLTKTVGYSSVALNLKPGRHVLKLWLDTDSPYVVDVSSNVNVVISKSPKIRFLMNAESQLVVQYINTVSNCFISLTQKFGKPDLPSALREFYDTIKPGNESVQNYHLKLDEFIEVFLNCIMLSLKDLIPNTEEVTLMVWALRSLFLNPGIRCDLPPGPPPSIAGSGKKPPVKKVFLVVKERTLSEILTDLSEESERVITVQRVFRGYRVRLLWKYQTPGRKEFKPFAEHLKKICDAVFAPPKREVQVGKLLRRIVMTKPDLLTTFKFHTDFSNVLQVEEFRGKMVNVEAFAWVPIARFVIACHGNEPTPCAFHLSCNLEQTVVQGFDNDTGCELFRMSNTVYPHYYHRNTLGYTILVFGWNEANPKPVNWRLEMVKMKYFEAMHLCNVLTSPTCQPCLMPGIDVFEIRNFYIPNSKSRIFRCLIKIRKRTLLTLRLSLSTSDVKFWVVIASEDRHAEWTSESTPVSGIIAQMISTNGAAIMPSLVLECVESMSHLDTDATVYVVEAFVLDNSWPLTKQEWGLVEPIRVNGESWKDSTTSVQSKRGGSESRKKLTRTSRKNTSEQKVENPFWLLQALNDADQQEPTVIEEDKSYAESVKAMKMQWEEGDPGRRKRGRELRMHFVHELYLEERKKHLNYGENYGESYDVEDTPLDPQSVLDRLSSFTYLTSSTSPTRYITSPRILPETPLQEILCRYRAETELASESKDGPWTDDVTDFSLKLVDDLVENMEDERKDFLRQCLHYRSVMTIFMNDELKLSSRLMEQAYETRAKLLERLMR